MRVPEDAQDKQLMKAVDVLKGMIGDSAKLLDAEITKKIAELDAKYEEELAKKEAEKKEKEAKNKNKKKK